MTIPATWAPGQWDPSISEQRETFNLLYGEFQRIEERISQFEEFTDQPISKFQRKISELRHQRDVIMHQLKRLPSYQQFREEVVMATA